MQRQVQECKNVNSIAWVGVSRHGNTNVVGIVDMRTSSAKDVPRPSMDTSLFRYWGEKARVGSVYKQSPTLQERSPRQGLILFDPTLPSVPCITATLYLLSLHWRLPRAQHARNVTPYYHRKRNHYGSRV
ncbi:hypothetical protein M405DRAFT_600620 [Rhizopogon salebrosus TDB-379]|nr:hypothetical protein M405DRAFT_600620 [Rhizopogon salebrosus TDB-379]